MRNTLGFSSSCSRLETLLPMSHDHAAELSPSPDTLGRAFAVGIVLNLGFLFIEAVFGVLAHSTALLADAAHNLSDVLGLFMAWGATTLARRTPSNLHTYGFRRSTVLAALANAVLLLAAVGGVAWEAIGRIRSPMPPQGATMMWVAAAGVVVNGVSALLFRARGRRDANVRGAFLHLTADAAVSAGVVVAGAVLWRTGWGWVDPVASLLVSAVVLVGTWGLLRDALHLALDGVPRKIEIEAVRTFLSSLPGVEGVHDLHIWAMSTTEVALTAHLVWPWGDRPPAFLETLEPELERRFGISHVTVQLDPPARVDCRRAADGVV
jgi:cobalt-zinc-cadmium efflux system protein